MLKRVYLFIILLLSVQLAYAQSSFNVDAPRVVSKSEVFRVVFTADGEIDDFVSPTFTGLDVLAGPSPSRMSSTQIINGKRTDAIEVSYTFIVRPKSDANASISAASATIGGKVYTTSAISVEVVKGDSNSSNSNSQSSSVSSSSRQQSSSNVSSDDIFLRLSFNKTKVVKGEPIIATLKLYTNVSIGGFEDIKFPVFNGFWSQEIETPQNINFVRESVDGKIYNAAVLRKYMLLPQQVGSITVDPAELICQIQVRVSGGRRGNSMFDDFFDSGYQTIKKRLSTKSAKITVAALPNGAPASFGGGVGKFTMDVKLSRKDLKAHEAGSIIVDIKGSGNLNLIENPNVELPADFETYDVKVDNNFSNGANGISGTKSFEFPFIARSEGKFVIPPVEYSYYDISSKKYNTLKSDSLVVDIAKGSGVASGPMIQGINKQQVANLGEDIRYIFTASPKLFAKGEFFIWSIWFFVTLVVIIIFFAALWFYLVSQIKFKGDIKRVRNKKANKIAKSRLKQANVYLTQNLSSAFYEELHKALLGYIGDKLSIQFADMQRDTISETLVSKGVSEANVADFMSLLDDCEMARYSQSGGVSQMQDVYSKAIVVISNLENSL